MTEPEGLFRDEAVEARRLPAPSRPLDLTDRAGDLAFWLLALLGVAFVIAVCTVPTGHGTVLHLLIG